MKVQELIDLIYSKSYYNIYDAEELIDGEFNCVAKNLNINEHRWHTVSTRVYKLEDGYVGITGPSQLKSESMYWEDCGCPCNAEEYEEVQITSYKPKEK